MKGNELVSVTKTDEERTIEDAGSLAMPAIALRETSLFEIDDAEVVEEEDIANDPTRMTNNEDKEAPIAYNDDLQGKVEESGAVAWAATAIRDMKPFAMSSDDNSDGYKY